MISLLLENISFIRHVVLAIGQQSQQGNLVVQVDLHVHCQVSSALVGQVYHLLCVFDGASKLLSYCFSGCASVHAPKYGLFEGKVHCLFSICQDSFEFCRSVDHGKKMFFGKVKFLGNVLLLLATPIILDHNFLLFVKIVALQIFLVFLEAQKLQLLAEGFQRAIHSFLQTCSKGRKIKNREDMVPSIVPISRIIAY